MTRFEIWSSNPDGSPIRLGEIQCAPDMERIWGALWRGNYIPHNAELMRDVRLSVVNIRKKHYRLNMGEMWLCDVKEIRERKFA